MTHILNERYKEAVAPALFDSLNLENPMQVPRLEKIVVNIGVGEALDNAKALDAAVTDISTITGQKPIITRARKSIANFKIAMKPRWVNANREPRAISKNIKVKIIYFLL